MKWKKRISKYKQELLAGIRRKCKFLFIPKTINGETRWLEWAIWKEVNCHHRDGDEWEVAYWEDTKENKDE
jgi:hypothetical protein